MKCPYLQYKDGGFLSYEHFCKLTGKKVGDQNNKEWVNNVCNSDRGAVYCDKCPAYRHR